MTFLHKQTIEATNVHMNVQIDVTWFTFNKETYFVSFIEFISAKQGFPSTHQMERVQGEASSQAHIAGLCV